MQSWPIEEEDRLIAWWREGYSAEQIAQRLPGRTRSAVLGKVKRLKLTRNNEVRKSRAPRKKQNARRKPEPESVPDIAVVTPHNPSLCTNIPWPAPGRCLWPIGEPGAPGFGFCARPQAPGRSYCEHHVKKARDAAQPTPRKRKKDTYKDRFSPAVGNVRWGT